MPSRICHFAMAVVTVSVSSMACSFEPADPIQIRQMMARETVHRLGARLQQVPLQAIFPPLLHTSFPLGAEGRGFGALLHGAGFRWSEGGQPVIEPSPRPRPQPKPWPVPSPRPKPWPWPWPDPEKPWPGPGPVPEPMGP